MHLSAPLPPALVTPSEVERLTRFLDRLPDDLASCLLCERVLGGAARGTDLTLHVEGGTRGARMLAGTLPGLSDAWFAHAAWQRARALAQAGHGWVLLEVDAEQMERALPVPHIFINPPGRGLEAGMRCLAGLTGGRPELAAFARVFACLQAVPAPHGLCLMGRMFGRGHDDVRVLIPFRRLADLRGYLAAVGWPGCASAEEGFRRVAADADCYLLNLEVGAEVRRRIGVEPYFFDLRAGQDPRWETYLRGMVAAGLCTVAEEAALRRFPGHRGADGTRGSVSTKLVIDGGLQLKAYLSLATPEASLEPLESLACR